jgi:hypothetical protein
VYVYQTLVTYPNEETPQSVHLLKPAAAHLKTAVKYCLFTRRTAGWLAGVKKVRQSTSSIEILRGFRQLLAVVLHVALYDARHSQWNSCADARPEVLSAVLLKIQVLWNVTPCRQ